MPKRAEMGLYLARNRMYHPTLGRWTARGIRVASPGFRGAPQVNHLGDEVMKVFRVS